jgi:hypothetical protein
MLLAKQELELVLERQLLELELEQEQGLQKA